MYFIFGIISVILVILSVITAVRLAKTERETRVLSALHWFTIGIFAAVLAIFYPGLLHGKQHRFRRSVS